MACANRVLAGRRFFLPARQQLFRIASRRLIAADHHPWEMAALTARQSVRFKPRTTLQTQTWNRKASLNGGLTFPRTCGNWPRTAFSMGAWEEILQHVERRVNPHSFATWFRPTQQEDTERDRLVIRVPTRLFRKRLTETYGELLQAVLLEVGLANTRLEFVCSEPEPSPSAGSGAAATATKQARLDFDAVDHQLNPRYTFETFVVGASNQFAHAASLAVAESPSKAYNPLFLYGGVGTGKTHLMQAVGHAIKKRNLTMRLTYISAEKFTMEVINSLRFDRMITFRDRFHTVDVLLVDDIQFIAGKERTQEEYAPYQR